VNKNSIKAFGDRLWKYCRSDEAFKLLDSSAAKGGSFTQGGCLILAEALKTSLNAHGIHAEVKYLYTDKPEHAVCMVMDTVGRPMFFDGDGASTAEDLLNLWIEEEGLRFPVGMKSISPMPNNMPQPGVEQAELVEVLDGLIGPTIEKYKEGEKIWTRKSRSGRSAMDIHVRHAERLDKASYFIQELNDKNGEGSGILIGTGDNCLRFVP